MSTGQTSRPSTLNHSVPAMTTKPSEPTPKPLPSYTLRKLPFRRYVTPFERIYNHRYQGSGTDEDPYIVDWLNDDPEDPQRWTGAYKWLTIVIVSIATLAVALSSSAYAGGVPSLIEEFGGSRELWIGGVSLFVVGFAFGPLFWAPASEVFGRRIVFIVSYLFLTLWTGVTIASPNIASVLIFRFLAGLFGSSPLANAGGVISDVLDANQRGLGMALFAAAPFLGPSLGPITGGFAGQYAGWRWVMGFLAIFCGCLSLVLIFSCPETYAPYLLRERAKLLSQTTGKVYRFRADAKKPLVVTELFATSLVRPWKFLIYEPIVIIMTLYTALVYGILYLNFAAYPIVFQQGRGWSTSIGGLAFLGILVGTVISVLISVLYINPQYIKTAKAKGGRATPEDRLPPAIWGGVLIVIGLAGFAATDGPDVHWIAPIIFGIPFGTGVIVMFLAVLGYLVDSYTIYAASVLAANSVLRSLFGAAFPLFTSDMYNALGIHWAAALPGFIALACIPFMVVFYKYGAGIRAKCKYSADAERQMAAIIAARMAAMKQDEESTPENVNGEGKTRQGSEATVTENPNVGDKHEAVGGASEGVNEKAPQTMPAEQAGGEGTTAAEARNEQGHSLYRSLSRRMSHTIHQPLPNETPEQHAYRKQEWGMYEILAGRDEVDLADEERLRLEQLHKKFDYARAK